MRYAIFDPTQHCVGLTLLFPEADYYSISPHSYFHYSQRTNEEFERVYKFPYKEDLTQLNDSTYDTLIFVFVTWDGKQETHTQFGADRMLASFEELVSTNKFQKVVVFDNHDYPYDPSLMYRAKINHFFKRNYCKDRTYAPHVSPFPFSMFGLPTCSLWSYLTDHSQFTNTEKRMGIFYAGALYKHENKEAGVFVDRETMFAQIKPYVQQYSGLSHIEYMKTMASHMFAVDLNGCGNPNKRTFEILLSRSLRIAQKNSVMFPFPTTFHPLTEFSSGDDFFQNIATLFQNPELYQEALKAQNLIFDTYFTKDWLRAYILERMNSTGGQ